MRANRLLGALLGRVARFAAAAEGAVLIQVGIALPALIGMALLAIDTSRLYSLHTSLQSAADALALAGAAELDRRPDSVTRANRAIDNLVRNDQRFGEGPTQITRAGISVRFLRTLPASDADPVTASHETADPAATRFVEVRVQPVGFNSILPASVIGALGSTQTGATAVAGFDQAVCHFAPVFICNPFEGSGTSIHDALKDPAWRRRLIALKQHGGGNAQYFPGNYGWLEPPTKPGASELKEMLAIDRPPACFIQNGVELRPGNISSARDAINVRFDLYEGSLKKNKGDPAYRPARNVRKGYVGNGCSQSPSEDPAKARGFPRDGCFATSSCPAVSPSMSGRVGDGHWDFEGYWSTNFGGRPKPVSDSGTPYSNANPPSRYDVYRYEIANDLVPVRSGPAGAPAGETETGAPQCYTGGAATLDDDPDRRLLPGAVLDCKALDEQYKITGGSSPPLPVTAFVRFFLAEPVEQGPEGTIWVELVDAVEPGAPGAGGIARDIVQLYR